MKEKLYDFYIELGDGSPEYEFKGITIEQKMKIENNIYEAYYARLPVPKYRAKTKNTPRKTQH